MGFRPTPSILPKRATVTLLLHMEPRNPLRGAFTAVLLSLLGLLTLPSMLPSPWKWWAHMLLLSAVIATSMLLVWRAVATRSGDAH